LVADGARPCGPQKHCGLWLLFDLHYCSLDGNQIGDAGAVALGEGLKNNTRLSTL